MPGDAGGGWAAAAACECRCLTGSWAACSLYLVEELLVARLGDGRVRSPAARWRRHEDLHSLVAGHGDQAPGFGCVAL